MSLDLHPLCALFPRMIGAEFDALKEDILEHGLRHRIVLYQGQILDGGNRYAACLETGLPPLTDEYAGDDPAAYVMSANLHRRHLAAGQAAAIVASAADWSKAHTHGGDRKSERSATLHLNSAADRAAQSGVSVRTQKDADKVAKVDPDLAKAVGHGEVTLAQAKKKINGHARPRTKPAAKIVQPDNPDMPTPGEVMDELNSENVALQAQVAALSAPDLATELRKQVELYQHAVREKDEEMNKNARLFRENATLSRFQSQVVAATGAENPKAALAWIHAHRVKA